jgi:hypothetical protein
MRRHPALLALAVAVVLLVAAGYVVGPAAGIAVAQEPGAAILAQEPGGATLAQVDGGDGFGENQVVDRYGIPVFEYEIEGRQGGGVDGTFDRLGIWLADVLFSTSRLIVVALIWLLDFALDFGVADLMLVPAQQLIGVYETNFVGTISGGGWGLVPLALMICVFWFGLAALRGRVGKGFGEIAMSFLLAVLLGAILANPGGLLIGDEGLVGRARDIGVDVATTAVQPPDADPPPCVQRLPVGGESLVDGCFVDEFGGGTPPTRSEPQYLRWIMQMWLVDMYVRRPHQHMTYGQRLDCPLVLTVRGTDGGDDASRCDAPYAEGGDHPCVDQYNLILQSDPATAPEAPGADPGSYMYDMMHPDEPVAGCPEGEPLAVYLESGGGDRIAVGMLLMLALLVLAAFLAIGVLIPIIIGQLMVAILAVALIFVLPIALLGGGGRRILWKWFGLLLAATFMLIVALVGLALMLITTELLLQSHQRFFFVNLLMVGVSSVLFLGLQRRLLRGSLAGGAAVGGALNRMKVGGGGGDAGGAGEGWVRTASVGYVPADRWSRDRKARGDIARNAKLTAQVTRQRERRQRWARRITRRSE